MSVLRPPALKSDTSEQKCLKYGTTSTILKIYSEITDNADASDA